MTVGVIDIGTNTVLLLVARMDASRRLDTIIDIQRTPRLGKGVDARRTLDRQAMDRVLHVLREYRSILERHHVSKTVVAATSAVRDATNRDAFRELVRKETGYILEILSGEEEATRAFQGAISGFSHLGDATVIDIGGGSTEITGGTPHGITHAISLDIGAVRLMERFLRSSPPTRAETEEMENWLRDQLAALQLPAGETELIGVAGTVTSLAVLDLGLSSFDRNAVARHVLSRERVRALYKLLCGKTPQEILGLSEVMAGREDIITAGTAILIGVMDRLEADSIAVSERGIRYGLAIRELGPKS